MLILGHGKRFGTEATGVTVHGHPDLPVTAAEGMIKDPGMILISLGRLSGKLRITSIEYVLIPGHKGACLKFQIKSFARVFTSILS